MPPSNCRRGSARVCVLAEPWPVLLQAHDEGILGFGAVLGEMIEVQEGQNLKITITGYRTAYRWASPFSSPRAGQWDHSHTLSLGTHPSLQVCSVLKM